MIITCASCLTKYHLDDSRISPKGSKVRCSRCQHVFYVVAPPETKEEIIEGFESIAKYPEEEELVEAEQKRVEPPPPAEVAKKEMKPQRKKNSSFLKRLLKKKRKK